MSDHSQPLHNRRVVVTRRAEQAPALALRVEELGGIPLLLPAITFAPLPLAALHAALEAFDTYDWVIFTSGNAVRYFLQGTAGRSLTWPRVAATGPATADKLEAAGVAVDFVPDEYVGEALAAGVGPLADRRVLLPRALKGRPDIVTQMRRQGAQVDDIPLYDTVTAAPDEAALARLEQGFDAVTFTSPSTVNGFCRLTAARPCIQQQLAAAVIACIGPVTAEAARAANLDVAVVPTAYTLDGLVTALGAHYGAR